MKSSLLSLLLFVVTTCSGSLAQTRSSRPANYIAFGDSITAGAGATTQQGAWPYWVARSFNGLVNDLGVAGNNSYSTDPIIFANAIRQSPNTLVSYMIGTNNRSAGSDPNQLAIWSANIAAQYAWMALPSANKMLFAQGGATYSGDWSAPPVFSVGRASSSGGSTVTFTGAGNTLYLVTAITNSNAGSASLSCDGNASGAQLAFTGSGNQAIPISSNGNVPAGATSFVRVSLPSGSHTCTVTNTSTSGSIELDWAAFLTGETVSSGPVVLASAVPSGNPTDPITPAYRAYQPQVVSMLNGDGLIKIKYVDDSATLTAPVDYFDNVHPNDYGHYLLAKPHISALNSAYGTSYLYPPYALPESNSALGGSHNYGDTSQSLSSPNLTGSFNTAIGWSTLTKDTTGNSNTAIGASALSMNLDGSFNTAVGQAALQVNLGGSYNTAIGADSLNANLTGAENVAIGTLALYQNTSGNENNAIGNGSLFSNSTGTNNVALGYASLFSNTTGFANTALGGYNTLYSNTTGINNTAVGFNSLAANTVGYNNTAQGYSALAGTTTGALNTGMGLAALVTNVDGNNNTAVGAFAGPASGHLSNTTSIGANAAASLSNSVQIGDSNVTSVTFGNGFFSASRQSGMSVAGMRVCTSDGLNCPASIAGLHTVHQSDGSEEVTSRLSLASGTSIDGAAICTADGKNCAGPNHSSAVITAGTQAGVGGTAACAPGYTCTASRGRVLVTPGTLSSLPAGALFTISWDNGTPYQATPICIATQNGGASTIGFLGISCNSETATFAAVTVTTIAGLPFLVDYSIQVP